MVIDVLSHVSQCYAWDDGETVGKLIRGALHSGNQVTVSFAGFDDVASPFVNAAFVTLLDEFSFDEIRQRLRVVNSTRQINEMIVQRLKFEAQETAHATEGNRE